MADINRINQVKIYPSDAHAVTAMKTTSMQSLQAVLSRMKIEYVQGFPSEIYAMALYDEICEKRQLILEILPKEVLLFLIQIWENESLEMDAQHWDYAKYLSMAGFLFTQKSGFLPGAPDSIYYISDMKEQFYFLLKSRSSQRTMDRYEEWEKIIQGLMYCYGLIDMRILYQNFLQVSSEENCPYEIFDHFVKCRSSLWGIGMFLRTADGQAEYFQHMHVENAEKTLKEMIRQEELSYYIPEKEQIIAFSKAGGIDRSWRGFAELVTLLGEELQLDYYRTTVCVRTLINAIQNGYSKESLFEKAEAIPFSNEDQRRRGRRSLEYLSDCVPLFSLKGNSRSFRNQIIYEKQLKKKRKLFTMIQGSKED